MTANDADYPRFYKALIAARLDPEVEAGREPPTGEFHSSIGLWQLPPPTWEEA